MSKVSKKQLRTRIRKGLDDVASKINDALKGHDLSKLEPVLARIGHGGRLPHWFSALKTKGTLPNLDGKTIGSVVEMLLVAVLESHLFTELDVPPLRINPARGVDLPDLDLGVKSPSENYCTSEPFFSAYERLLGSEYDIVVLLTDYQTAKKQPPLRLQIIKWRYLAKTQIADENLCRIARSHRDWLLQEDESWAKRVFRFLAYVNQSDWRAKKILGLVEALQDEEQIQRGIEAARRDFDRMNVLAESREKPLMPDSEKKALERILGMKPLHLGVIDAADNWVVESWKDAGRLPNDNEWIRLKSGPLDGLIGMSFALQWRYNFGRLFNSNSRQCE